jgi:predicted nucleic acid-binding protein
MSGKPTGKSLVILLDTNVLFAAFFAKDSRNQIAKQLLRSLQGEAQIVAAPVLNELFYLATERVNYKHAVVVFTAVRENFQIEALNVADMRRMEAIMRKYADSRFDFADTAIMAQAERLNITRVATFDRRDFPIFRPTHCETLELLP